MSEGLLCSLSSVISSPCSPPHLPGAFSAEGTVERDETDYYRRKYLQMKSINQAIIAAIKRVYSPEVAQELEILL